MDDGNLISDHSKSNDGNFYSQLYTSEFPNDNILAILENFLNHLIIPKLSPNNKMRLDEHTSKEEIAVAICSLQSRKSPGPDKLPAEFFYNFLHCFHLN